MLNTNYMSMCEHLILFMLETYIDRQTAEHKLIEFMISLKYYADKWDRAMSYAKMCGFLSNVQSPEDLNLPKNQIDLY